MNKRYSSVQEMLDDIADPEFAEEFRRHEKKLIVRLRRKLLLFICWIKQSWHANRS